MDKNNYEILSVDILVALWKESKLTVLNESLLPLYLYRNQNADQWLAARAIDSRRPNSRLLKKALRLAEKDEEEAELIAQIKEEPIYKLIANCQNKNGWLGNGFHGPNKKAGPYENQEVGTKWFAEKAVGKEKRVFNDYEKWPCYYHLDILAHTES